LRKRKREKEIERERDVEKSLCGLGGKEAAC
jgi:hypothetical protein